MKAAVLHAPNDLRIEDHDPGAPAAGEVRIAIAAGGICGSDLHYYQHGGFGAVRLREPMVLGHEVAGVVDAVGAGVTRVRPGDPVAVNPSRPCGTCRYCLEGAANHCLDMRFLGSAMRMPHVQGGFAQAVLAGEAQCEPVPVTLPLTHAAVAEPLAVGLHAVRWAGPLLGRRVLVTGQGPIGVLAVAAARLAGAAEIIATDIVDAPLAVSRQMGADRTVNVAADPDGLAAEAAGKGQVDVVLEATGTGRAIQTALSVLRPRGILVQLGLGDDVSVPLAALVTRELDWRGTFRFHEEFALAVRTLAAGRIDVTPLLTEVVPLDEANRAFSLAADRNRAMKVLLRLSAAAQSRA